MQRKPTRSRRGARSAARPIGLAVGFVMSTCFLAFGVMWSALALT